MARRTRDTLLALEVRILEAALALRRAEQGACGGFGLAHAMRERSESRSLPSHGTLYRSLGRLEELGLLRSRWEDPASAEGRPRRRLYELTERGGEVAVGSRSTGTVSLRPSGRVAPGTA